MTGITTLTRVGIYEPIDVYQRLRAFNAGIQSTPSVLGNTRQFAYFEEQTPEYLLMVSHSIATLRPGQPFNLVVTVTSEDPERNIWVMEKVGDRAGFSLRETSLEHAAQMNNLNMVYPVFKRLGRRGVDFLAQLQRTS